MFYVPSYFTILNSTFLMKPDTPLKNFLTESFRPLISITWIQIQNYYLKKSIKLNNLMNRVIICLNNAHSVSKVPISAHFFKLTSQSVGINRMRTHTNKAYFAVSFNRLSCQFAEKWATEFWAFFPFLRNLSFSPRNL